MSEKLPVYMLTSREYKVEGLRDGLQPYGVDVGWIMTPAYSKEPDHIEDLDEAAKEKLRMFARLIGRTEIAAQIPESVALWRLLIMDVAGSIALPAGGKETLTTCRNVVVVGEKINGTAKMLIGSPSTESGMKEVRWSQATAHATQGRETRIQGFGSRIASASLLVNEKLAVAMEKNSWYHRVKLDGKYRGALVVNPGSSGGLDWTKLPQVLAEGEEVVWDNGSHIYHARGKRIGSPDVEDGMIQDMDDYLRRFPQPTLQWIASLT